VKRLLVAALLAVCAGFAADAQTVSPYPALTIPLKIDQVPGQPVWYSTGNHGIPGKDNEGNTSNAAFVATSDGVAVFDALGTPSLGWALLQEIRKETRAQVEAEMNLDRYEELEPRVRERLDEQLEARIEGEYRAARERLLEEMYSWFGDLLLCAEGADDKLLAHPDQAPAVRRAATGLTYLETCQDLEAIEQIRDSLSRNISETLAFEVGLLKLA